MTREEAIKYIEQHSFIDDVVKDMCIEALEKQIPKKVINEVQFYDYCECPSCESIAINSYGCRYGYCPECGQKLTR